jgi:hypothetical protein
MAIIASSLWGLRLTWHNNAHYAYPGSLFSRLSSKIARSSVSLDGQRAAQIDHAGEVSMGNPTSGMLCVTGGPHMERCNPSFVWSDDSRYLAVPQFSGFFGRQRLLILSFEEKRVFASKERAWYFQPESFSRGQLLATINPFRSPRGPSERVRQTEERNG